MAQTYQDTNVNQLVINKLTKQEYNNLSQISETELYLVEEQVDSVVTQNSTNPVQSGAVFTAIQDAKDVIMCKMSDGLVYDSYITYTKVKQYLPDYPYYSDDLNWEIGGNPPMRANITADNYYLDVDTKHIFVADENLELLDITSSVVIHGDINKLYCDVDTNILYRYDGTNFVALTSNFSGDYNDLINKPDLNFLKQRDLTTYQVENDEIVQHVGNNSSGYINGYVYKKSNVHSLTYNSVTYTYVGETDGNVTWKLYKITQDNIDYVVPQGVTIGDNFWVVRDFTDLEVVHIFEIDNIGENVEGTQRDIEGHFLGTNITLHFVAPYSEITHTSKALIYKNGNNYLYCDSTFKFFASSVNNNNANVIPFDGTINNDYICQRINVQPQQLSLENSKVKYTLSDQTTKLTLAQENELKAVAFSGSYNDLTDKLQNATTTTAGLMSAEDKVRLGIPHFANYTSLRNLIEYLIGQGYYFYRFSCSTINVSSGLPVYPQGGALCFVEYTCRPSASNAVNITVRINGKGYNIYIGCFYRNDTAGSEATWQEILAQNL